MTSLFIGDIDEGGYLNNLERNGIDGYKSLSEIIANSIDACARNIILNVTPNTIEIHDDGNGMNQEGIKNMFSINRSNHQNQKALGISGYGSKAAFNNLASFNQPMRTTVIIYTYHIDEKILYKIEIPWKKIFDLRKYTGQIICVKASNTEISNYVNIRNKLNLPIFGTQIIFEPSDYIKQCIEEQFIHYKTLSPSCQLSVIFGKFDVDIKYVNDNNVFTLEKYNPLGFEDSKYYNNKSIYTIMVYKTQDGTTKYISLINDKKYEFKKKGLGYEKKPSEIDGKTLHSCKFEGTINIIIGLMKNQILDNPIYLKQIFQNTEKKNNDFKDHINKEYEEKFFDITKNKDVLTQCLSHSRLYRNGQNISFITTNIKPSSARADYQTYIKIRHCPCEIIYETISDQQSELDKIMGIQQNKNQHSGNIDKSLERWVDYYRNEHWNGIKEYFINYLNDNKNIQTQEDTNNIPDLQIVDTMQEINQSPEEKIADSIEDTYMCSDYNINYVIEPIKVREYEYFRGPQPKENLLLILSRAQNFLEKCKISHVDATLYNNGIKIHNEIISLLK